MSIKLGCSRGKARGGLLVERDMGEIIGTSMPRPRNGWLPFGQAHVEVRGVMSFLHDEHGGVLGKIFLG
jgi:hypothetical protein